MHIDNDLISHLEKLARLKLQADERDRLRQDLDRMLAMVEKIQELDLESTPPLRHLQASGPPLRPDTVSGQVSRAAALSNSPDSDDQFFRVPKVIK